MRLFVLCFALVLLLAQAPAEATPGIEEVKVTGQRNVLGQSLALAGTGESITGSEQVSFHRTAGDWLEVLPGVSLNGQGGLFQSYSVRGFSRWRVRTN